MNRRNLRITWRELVAIVILVALAGIVVSTMTPSFSRAREAARRASCQNNLKQMGLVFKMFVNEHKDQYPPLSPVENNWIFDVNAVYPDYLNDLNILVCPSSPFGHLDPFVLHRTTNHRNAQEGTRHPDCVSSIFYNYTGYAVFNDEQAYALFRQRNTQPGPVFARNPLHIRVPRATSYRGPTPSPSAVPVMWDRIFVDESAMAHIPRGANVLHMDGHVEFVRYSFYNNTNFFPVTRLSAETFGSVLPKLPSDCYPY